MTREEAIAEYLGITIDEAEMVDTCDLTDEDMDEIDRIMFG